MKQINVGITFFASEQGLGSIWANGALQNCWYLHQLLRHVPGVNELWWINEGEEQVLPEGLLLDDPEIRLVRLEDVAHRLDLVIELHAQLTREKVAALRGRGSKVVSMRVGNDFVIDLERTLFDKPGGLPMTGAVYDRVWTLPQHERLCRDYFAVPLRCPVEVVPHIWSPYFLDKATRHPELAGRGYDPARRKKRVSIFEPNLDLIKTAHYPMLICELAYRARPDLIDHVYVTCADHLKQRPLFVHFANALDVVRDGVCTFEARFPTPWFLAEHTDIVLSHQWENELNYLFYDVAHQGYPLVHNSRMLREYGYHYRPFDAEDGARVLCDAIERHDRERDAYLARQQGMLAAVDVAAPGNVDAYAAAIRRVCGA